MGFRPPKWGKDSIAGFWATEGGSIAEFANFQPRSARNGAEGAILETLENLFEHFTKLMYSKSTKIAFKGLFKWTHFCVRTLNFVPEISTI